MADLLPSSPDVDPPEEPRVVGVDSDDAEDLLAALSSGTARGILAALHEEPSPPSRVAERVDTSLQNAQYHLGRLEDAGVVEVADTVYSEKGREMKVYAPADRALVVVAGPQEESDGLRSALSRLLGGVGALAVGSVVVDRVARRFGLGPVAPTTDRGAGGAAEVETTGETTAADDAGGSGDSGGAGDAGGADGAGDTPTPSGGDDAGAMAVETESGTTTSTPTGTATSTESGDLGTLAEPSGTATETARETATPTPMATGTPTSTPTPTETATATPAPTSTPTATPTPTPTPTAESTTTVVETTTAVATTEPTTPVAALASSPGALFFLGGLTVLVAWFALVAYRARR